MTQQATCPSSIDLQQFLAGRLAVARSEEMAAHFLHCPRCLETVHNLNANDTLTESLRGRSGTAAPNNPMLQQLMQRLKALPPAPEQTQAEVAPLAANENEVTLDGCDFLAPAEGPGEMGRLGTYRILKVLGQGGMGMVFEAEDARLKRRVALKVMRPAIAANPAARQRFLREAQAAAALTHDHVVTIHQVDEVGGVPFMAMQVLVGEALDDRLKREARLPLAEVLRIGRETAEGLAAAHEAGLIHRDIKPGNLWLESPRGRVKILDFGLARVAADNAQLTQSGAIVGTPAYMAPEQARGEKVDGRCDLFSLGSVLYRLATGKPPFRGSDTMSTLLALATDRPTPPRQLNPDIPKPLADLILQLLAKNPDERPASARIVAERLDAIAQGPSGEVRAAPPSRRRWLAVATAAAFLAGLIALTVVILRDKQGKEVARFNVPEGGSVEMKEGDGGTKDAPPAKGPPAAPARADREKPFVLVRKGAETGAFKTFTALWEGHQPGDEIIVYGNGPFRLPHVDVKERTLVVKAAPGYRPVFLPDESLFEKPQGRFQLQSGGMTVEGCDFVMRGTPPGLLPPELIRGGDKPCVLRGCRFVEFGYLLPDFRSSALTLEDCLLLADSLGDLPARCELTLTNNLICCYYLMGHLRAPGGQKLRLTRNAIAAWIAPQIDPGVTGMTVTEEGNLFDGWPITKEGFKGQLNWQGKDNCYVHLKKGLAGWNAQLTEPETNSREVPALPFGWLTEVPPGGAKQALAWLQTHLAEARRESGLNDLGPDLSLVGPGEAYLRGLADEGRAAAKEQLRPEPLTGGRVVLIRGGKAERGFHLLQTALNAVQDGDVLEIRTDAALVGGKIPADRGALVIRAGAGYRPVIQTSLDLLHGTAVALEGLAFSDGGLYTHREKNLPPEKQGRVTRLAYCAFDRHRETGNHVLSCFVSGRDGSPGEVLRCAMLGPVRLHAGKGTQVRLRECVLGATVSRWPEDKDATGTFQMDGCVLTSSVRTALIDDVCGHGRSKSQWTVHRCLLESNGGMLPGNVPPGWTGERNLYRIGPNWAGDQGIHGLVQWRARMKSPETASVEGLPPVADPRTWKLPSGIVPNGTGPDVDKVARTAKGDKP